VIAESQDSLQKGVFTLHNIAKDFQVEISPEKPETTALLQQDPVG
jgi:hypothetical protein